MGIDTLISNILYKSPTGIHDIVKSYYGAFYLDNIECELRYDLESGKYKLLDINTDNVGVIVDTIITKYWTNYAETAKDCTIFGLIEFKSYNGMLDHIKLFRKISGSYKFITWMKSGEKFDIVYDNHIKRHHIIRLDTPFCIEPSNELYTISPVNSLMNSTVDLRHTSSYEGSHNGLYRVFYDRENGVILNKDKTHVAILLSMGWDAPIHEDKKSIFDVSKILQILPNTKLTSSQLSLYPTNSIVRYLCVHWVPVNKKFIIYYNSDKGENYKLEDDFRYVA